MHYGYKVHLHVTMPLLISRDKTFTHPHTHTHTPHTLKYLFVIIFICEWSSFMHTCGLITCTCTCTHTHIHTHKQTPEDHVICTFISSHISTCLALQPPSDHTHSHTHQCDDAVCCYFKWFSAHRAVCKEELCPSCEKFKRWMARHSKDCAQSCGLEQCKSRKVWFVCVYDRTLACMSAWACTCMSLCMHNYSSA